MAVQPQGAYGPDAQLLDQRWQLQPSLMDKREAEAQGGLQATDTHRRLVELAELVLHGVGSVIRGDAVDGAVKEAGDTGGGVPGRA